MTPQKKKGDELIRKFAFQTISDLSNENFEQTKQCALICVNELILSHKQYAGKENDYRFWIEVKEELEKL